MSPASPLAVPSPHPYKPRGAPLQNSPYRSPCAHNPLHPPPSILTRREEPAEHPPPCGSPITSPYPAPEYPHRIRAPFRSPPPERRLAYAPRTLPPVQDPYWYPLLPPDRLPFLRPCLVPPQPGCYSEPPPPQHAWSHQYSPQNSAPSRQS